MTEIIEPRQSNHVSWNRGKSARRQWLVDRVHFDSDECLIWPFSLTRGYGAFQCLRKRHYAHRYMCELANGAPPAPSHEAAHSCGRGDQGCVNPRHLSWKTKAENALDCREHGTQSKSTYGRIGKLTHEQVAEIRLSSEKGGDLARRFGVHETTISNIRTGRTRKADQTFLSASDIHLIRSTVLERGSATRLANALGVSGSTISRIRKGVGYKNVLLTPAQSKLIEKIGEGQS